MKIINVFFSATDTTRRVVMEIAKQMGNEWQSYDLTKNAMTEDVNVGTDDVLLVGMPVYGGRIPAPVVYSLKRFKGRHTPAILVAVYGNRAVDDAFVEMQDIVEGNGFFVMAAGAFVAQHSIFPHTAQGRPDEKDMEKIRKFASQCTEKINRGYSDNTPSIHLPGNRPYKIPGKIPLKVTTNSHCTECGTCIKVCPVGAIPKENPHVTDYDRCIHCGRCISHCKEHVRGYSGLLYRIAGFMFGRKNSKRQEPEVYL